MVCNHYAGAGMRPLWRSSGSVDGSRPLKSCDHAQELKQCSYNHIHFQAKKLHLVDTMRRPQLQGECGHFTRHRRSNKTRICSNKHKLFLDVILHALRVRSLNHLRNLTPNMRSPTQTYAAVGGSHCRTSVSWSHKVGARSHAP